jgi:hypothetical protein
MGAGSSPAEHTPLGEQVGPERPRLQGQEVDAFSAAYGLDVHPRSAAGSRQERAAREIGRLSSQIGQQAAGISVIERMRDEGLLSASQAEASIAAHRSIIGDLHKQLAEWQAVLHQAQRKQAAMKSSTSAATSSELRRPVRARPRERRCSPARRTRQQSGSRGDPDQGEPPGEHRPAPLRGWLV